MDILLLVVAVLTGCVLGAIVTGAVVRPSPAPVPFIPAPAPGPDPAVALLQDQVRQILDNQAELRGVSEYQMSQVLDSTRILQLEASKLSGALSNNQIRGNWGEIQLRRSLEVAGMLPHTDFVEQAPLDNGTKRPDVVVNLPGSKHVIIDSKASMNYYLELVKSETGANADSLLAAHARTLKQHVQALSGKEYWKALPHTAEFVVLFVPNDAALAAAVTSDGTLMEFAAERKVILAGPSTLLAILFAIAQSWRQETATANVEQIAALGLELYNRLQAMSGPFDDIQKKLDEAQASLKAVRWHMSDRIFVTGRKLQQLTGAPRALVERDVQ
jgi:DNA recombination protein RmuC